MYYDICFCFIIGFVWGLSCGNVLKMQVNKHNSYFKETEHYIWCFSFQIFFLSWSLIPLWIKINTVTFHLFMAQFMPHSFLFKTHFLRHSFFPLTFNDLQSPKIISEKAFRVTADARASGILTTHRPACKNTSYQHFLPENCILDAVHFNNHRLHMALL